MPRGTVFKHIWRDGHTVSWRIKYQLPSGEQKVETIGPLKKVAERVLSERLRAIDAGTYQELREATFEEFSRRWLADYAKPRLKPSTYEGYERAIEKRWIPAFGSQPLRSLSTGRLQEEVSRLSAEGLAPKSVNNFAVILGKVLGDAVKWGYLAHNPASGLERLRVPHHETRALSAAEVRRFLAAVEPDQRLFFELAVMTGLRRGELLGLKWKDVDFAGARLRVERAVWRGRFVTPKSARSVRRVDLAPSLMERLRAEYPGENEEGVGERLIFPGPGGGPREPDHFVKRRFRDALRRAGLPQIRFHDLRHTFASLLIAAGEHPKAIQAALGHASITTTLDRYGHLLDSPHRHGGERLEALVWGTQNGGGEEA